MRIGLGYDVHELVTDRDLIIGGVKIKHEKGLLGHSPPRIDPAARTQETSRPRHHHGTPGSHTNTECIHLIIPTRKRT